LTPLLIRLTQGALAALLLTLLSSGLTHAATATDWSPWEVPAGGEPRGSTPELNPFDQAIRNFQTYISPVDGARCPMYPTCSAYARQALHKHGTLLGLFLTADRLIHEGDPIEHQEPLLKWGIRRYYDPLSYNDFWLKR
jgi:hypothetical protein